LIAGLEIPSAGHILFDDQDVTDASLANVHCHGLPELRALSAMTVAENIGFPCA
jgi:ABC-type sugar transport system ATPase subunit